MLPYLALLYFLYFPVEIKFLPTGTSIYVELVFGDAYNFTGPAVSHKK
nr:MAG TPA: hypothetical protein [Caudoviricetes sp.]DAZ63328.1 MAG TPA: hypothetical protein [Caudoviricetes sp.]